MPCRHPRHSRRWGKTWMPRGCCCLLPPPQHPPPLLPQQPDAWTALAPGYPQCQGPHQHSQCSPLPPHHHHHHHHQAQAAGTQRICFAWPGQRRWVGAQRKMRDRQVQGWLHPLQGAQRGGGKSQRRRRWRRSVQGRLQRPQPRCYCCRRCCRPRRRCCCRPLQRMQRVPCAPGCWAAAGRAPARPLQSPSPIPYTRRPLRSWSSPRA